eukprot:s34_g40.t1
MLPLLQVGSSQFQQVLHIEMAVAMRLLVIFLVWLPVKAAVADCKGNVAGDKIWMCPDVDVSQCPLTYASTGFSPEYIQCGVAGKSCVSLGPLSSKARSNADVIVCCNALLRAGLDVQSPIYEEMLRAVARNLSSLRPFEVRYIPQAVLFVCIKPISTDRIAQYFSFAMGSYWRLSRQGILIIERCFQRERSRVVLMPMVHVAVKDFFTSTLRSQRFHQFDAIYHEGHIGCSDEVEFPTWRFTPSLRNASIMAGLLEMCWMLWFRFPLAVSNSLCRCLGWQPLVLQPEPLCPQTEPSRDGAVKALISEAPAASSSFAVPWGVAHMHYIEKRLLTAGFVEVEDGFRAHLACSWGTTIAVNLIILAWWWLLYALSLTCLVWYHTGRIIVRMPFYSLCGASLHIGEVQTETEELPASRNDERKVIAALLASCLARMRRRDPVLLRGARQVVEGAVTEGAGETLLRGSMVLQALSILEPEQRPKALCKTVEGTLQSWWASEDFQLPPEVLQRSLLSLVQAEVAWINEEQPAPHAPALMQSVAEYLAGQVP